MATSSADHSSDGGGGGDGGDGEGGGGGGDDGGGDGLEAKSTGNHCGGTARLSDWRAWAIELGLDEIHGLMVLVPVVPARMRPCQLKRRGQEPRVERSETECAASCPDE